MTLETGNISNSPTVLEREYNNAVNGLSLTWKNKFETAINKNKNKSMYFEQKITFFKRLIYDMEVNIQSERGFLWLLMYQEQKELFFSHLINLRENNPINYIFMNRCLDGEKFKPFEGDIIPEVYAGAAWKHFNWILEKKNKFENESKIIANKLPVEHGPYLDLTNAKYNAREIGFYYFYNENEYNDKNVSYRSQYYGLAPKKLSDKLTEFKRTYSDIDFALESKKKSNVALNLYQKMAQFITNSNGLEKVNIFITELEKKIKENKKSGVF